MLWAGEKANDVGLTTLILSFREEEEKDVRDSNVRPEGQVNIVGFRGKEVINTTKRQHTEWKMCK